MCVCDIVRKYCILLYKYFLEILIQSVLFLIGVGKVMRDYSLDKDEVLKRKVIEVADYVISTKASTRATANYFTSCRFPISNVTVHTYLNKRLKEIDFVRYQQVREILEGNSPESILDAEVRKRIYQAVALLLQGDTISQIAIKLNSTFDIIYDDITSRFFKLEKDMELLSRVRIILKEHSRNNLNNQGKNTKRIR